MDEAELRSDLATGETPSIEFKRCGNSVGRDTFETICSFANSFGGSIYLGAVSYTHLTLPTILLV